MLKDWLQLRQMVLNIVSYHLIVIQPECAYQPLVCFDHGVVVINDKENGMGGCVGDSPSRQLSRQASANCFGNMERSAWA